MIRNETTQIGADLHESSKTLLKAIEDLSEEEFEKKTADNKWSIREVLEHLMILEKTLIGVVQGKTESLKDRTADSKVELIKNVFLNFNKKYNAPEFIVPKGNLKDSKLIIEHLFANRKTLMEFTESNDMSELCQDFKHDYFQDLTRLEWIYFIIFHAQRHTIQITNTKKDIRHQ